MTHLRETSGGRFLLGMSIPFLLYGVLALLWRLWAAVELM